MVTVVNTPSQSDEGSGAGWAVATVVIILVVLFALFLWPRLPFGAANPQQPESANINVTVPTPTGGTGGTGGGDTGGANQ